MRASQMTLKPFPTPVRTVISRELSEKMSVLVNLCVCR